MRRISGSLDAGLALAAHRLVEGALGVVPGERVVLVHDVSQQEFADFVVEAVVATRGQVSRFRLEDLGPRPHARLHERIAQAMEEAQSSVLLASLHPGELPMRSELVDLAERRRLRHGHMVGVSRASLVAGFSVDPHRIAEKARAISARLRLDSRIHVRSAARTDLVVELAPRCRWVEHGAVVPRGRRVNLPGGELVTSPANASGVYVADGTYADGDGVLSGGRLATTPITLRVEAARVTHVECARDPSLARAVADRISRVPNLDRVGLVSFGLNLGLGAPVGDIFADQKVPGVHLSLGESFPQRTGALITSKSWVAFTAQDTDVDIDRIAVLRRGRFMV
jgi:leucyl aminopeptidase (aminopeptidase T)